jgi:Bifunctional DNA primase/polymerase, N-terminal
VSGVFAKWQPRYALRGIATLPVDADRKAPSVKKPERFGIPASTQLIRRFPKANALGFIAGQRNNITVLDIDTDDERVLADALIRHGHTPLIVRTASGKFHAYYRHNGERRRIRPFAGLPIDVIGGGLLVAPPSKTQRGTYEIIEGTLDDLDRLTPVRLCGPAIEREQVPQGGRNNALYIRCMRQAHHCDSFDQLLDVARTENDQTNLPPLDDTEVFKIARSAWGYTERGENRYGKTGVWFSTEEVNSLIRTDPEKYLLKSFLRANNGPKSTFMITNSLATSLGMTRKRLSATRRRLEQSDLEKVKPATKQSPALYRWKVKGGQN